VHSFHGGTVLIKIVRSDFSYWYCYSEQLFTEIFFILFISFWVWPFSLLIEGVGYPITGLNRPVGLQEFEAPRISIKSAREGGKAAFATHEIFLILISVWGTVDRRAGRIKSIKKPNDTIGNRPRDIPACNAVPQPTAPPRVLIVGAECYCWAWLHSLTHTYSIGFPWSRDRPVAETSVCQNTTFTTDRHPCPQRNSNPQSHQASGRRLTP